MPVGELGARVDAPAIGNGFTPLIAAAYGGHIEAVELLLTLGLSSASGQRASDGAGAEAPASARTGVPAAAPASAAPAGAAPAGAVPAGALCGPAGSAESSGCICGGWGAALFYIIISQLGSATAI